MLLPHLMNCPDFITQLTFRFLKFVGKIVQSGNTKLQWILKHCAQNGNTMSNFKFVTEKWGMSHAEILNGNSPRLLLHDCDDPTWKQRAQAILDFMAMSYDAEGKDSVNLKDIIDFT